MTVNAIRGGSHDVVRASTEHPHGLGKERGTWHLRSDDVATEPEAATKKALAWRDLDIGSSVRMSRGKASAGRWIVEDFTADREVVWVTHANTGQRLLVHAADETDLIQVLPARDGEWPPLT